MSKSLLKLSVVSGLMALSFVGGAVFAQQSHLDKAIVSLKSALAEAIQCGGGGADGSGCKGPRGEAIKLMNDALKKLYEAGSQK